ncbi:MAG: hypothetical protein IJK92_00485 [Bacteroidales bacterium]|nr:hypothetical protein [Bacteroidales bacterium]
MKKFLAIAFLLFAGCILKAQNYPSDWVKYTSDRYFHDIESASSKQTALDLSRTNLARQIQVKVQEQSQIDKQAVNGKTSVLYSSQKNFSTDVDMDLAQTQSYYDESASKYYVITYINRQEACNYYENDVKMFVSNVNNIIAIADNYINTGFKSKAKDELQRALDMFDGRIGKPFFWMNVFGLDEYEIRQYLNKVNKLEQTVKSKLADLEYGTTYCIVCTADNFGRKYFKLQNEIKGDLSESGCNFVDDPNTADYVIYIDAAAREYNKVETGNVTAYHSFVDAAIAIDKVATNQRIYEDEISVKGSHTLSFDEAGRDGYKKIRKEISKMLKENIKL